MLRRESKPNDNVELYETRIYNVRQSIKQRLRSLRKRSKNESPLEYFPMDFINEEKPDSCSMTTEVLKNEIKQKILSAVRYLGGGFQEVFQNMETGELNKDIFINTSSRTVRNLAFLWAAFVGRLDYMQILHELGVDVGFSFETDNFNALHLTALSGSTTCCEWLLSKKCRFQQTNKGYLPVHFAALGNSRCCIDLLLQYGCELPDTLLNSAVHGNSVECVEVLLALEDIEVNTFDSDGMTPLHIAADQSSIYCLRCLLNHPLCNKDLKTDDERRYTAVHLAAENGYDQCIQSLADMGANLNEVNSKKETPLHLACKMQYPDCVEVLLQNYANVNAQNNDERTPLHCAVAKSRLALLIVQKLVEWHADVNATDWYGFTPLHIAALNELDECVEFLIMSGSNVAAKTKAGLSALNVINRKTPVSVSKIPRRLNLSLAYNAEQSLKFSFRDIITNSEIGEVDFLYTLQKEGQSCVLKHPLCRAFLHLKWQKVRPYYLLRVGISTAAIVLLSLYIMVASLNRCCDKNDSSAHCSGRNESLLRKISEETFLDEFHEHPLIIHIIKVVILLLVFLNITKMFFSLAAYKSAKHYFSKKCNILELSIMVCIFMLCVTTEIEFRKWWQCIMGAMTVLLCWVYLMIMVGQMPAFGAYISMFTKVLQEFSKLLVAYFCVLIGFTITLCVLFPDHHVFRNPLSGFVKVMAMMTGELNLDDLVNAVKVRHIKFTVFFILALFIIFVTVVLMNLLVGIAVHDVEGLHKTADLTKLVHQTQLIHFLELTCFNGYFPRKISDIFQNFLFVSPRMYRVVIYVRPLNPQEKRLPRDVMEEGLKIALDRSKARSMKNNAKQDMESRLDSLEKEIKKLQTVMSEIGNNVKNLVK